MKLRPCCQELYDPGCALGKRMEVLMVRGV